MSWKATYKHREKRVRKSDTVQGFTSKHISLYLALKQAQRLFFYYKEEKNG